MSTEGWLFWFGREWEYGSSLGKSAQFILVVLVKNNIFYNLKTSVCIAETVQPVHTQICMGPSSRHWGFVNGTNRSLSPGAFANRKGTVTGTALLGVLLRLGEQEELVRGLESGEWGGVRVLR